MRKRKDTPEQTPVEWRRLRRRQCLACLIVTLFSLDCGVLAKATVLNFDDEYDTPPTLIEPSETATFPVQISPTPTETPTVVIENTPIPTLVALEPELEPDVVISITATALPPDAETNFQPNLEFSREDYDLLRCSVFQIDVEGIDAEGVSLFITGTAWVVAKNDTTLFLATNAHVLDVKDADNLPNVKITRPSIDTQIFAAENVPFSLHPSFDLAIISFPLEGIKLDEPAPPLAFQEHKFPAVGTPVMTLGFPAVTSNYGEASQSLTFVETGEVEPYLNDLSYHYLLSFGNVGHGMSGSPVVVHDTQTGQLYVVGIVRAISHVTEQTETTSQYRHVFEAERLNFRWFNIPEVRQAALRPAAIPFTAQKQQFLQEESDVMKSS